MFHDLLYVILYLMSIIFDFIGSVMPTVIAYNAHSMKVTVRSFAKINLGLYIGALRADGFHDLRTVYQTIALHDVIRVGVRQNARGREIELLCDDPRVPLDASNTCYRMVERVLDELGAKVNVTIEIEKRLPVQGGLGAASSNAVATMIGLELALKKKLAPAVRLRIAAEVGSDLPLFLVGGTTLGIGRGEGSLSVSRICRRWRWLLLRLKWEFLLHAHSPIGTRWCSVVTGLRPVLAGQSPAATQRRH